jgi:hypothetical protein
MAATRLVPVAVANVDMREVVARILDRGRRVVFLDVIW